MISVSNIKLIKSLSQKKYRKIHQLFVVEGERLISEVIRSNITITQLFITTSFTLKSQHKSIIDEISKKELKSNIISNKNMEKIANTVTPSGILAVCEIPQLVTINSIARENWLYIDSIKDPGNLGTLLRSASWFGIKQIALSENCIDVYNPKVLRSGMGAHFHLNIYRNIAISEYSKSSHTIIGGFQTGENIQNIDVKNIKPWILVIGSEARGINQNLSNNISQKVTIPKIGTGESLNAAVAGSILLYYLTKSG